MQMRSGIQQLGAGGKLDSQAGTGFATQMVWCRPAVDRSFMVERLAQSRVMVLTSEFVKWE